ncbi:MAG TPA: hypothetical protein VGN19_08895 [Pedococcus sp.]|jgi:hypothetical protein|nr:hypothetical protein [Pedococcus sp.]
MSITSDPLFVAAEAQWRRERLTTAYQAPGAEGDDVLAPRPGHPLRRLLVRRLPHRHERRDSAAAARAA